MAVHLVCAVPDVARRGYLDLLGSVLLESIQKDESCQEMVNTSPSAEALQSPDFFFLLSKCFLSIFLTQESAAYCEPVSGGVGRGRRGLFVTG